MRDTIKEDDEEEEQREDNFVSVNTTAIDEGIDQEEKKVTIASMIVILMQLRWIRTTHMLHRRRTIPLAI